MRAFRCGLLLTLWVVQQALAGQLVGGESVHTVRPGEYLILISARYGMSAQRLALENGLTEGMLIHPGQMLKVDNRHVVPEGYTDGVVINVPQRMLYLFRAGQLVSAYPVGLGRASWQTPIGVFSVRNKAMDKTWIVPESIQEEMRRDGKPVLVSVPPGPDNPLGRYWIGLTPGIWGIHGTIAPASVYHFQSHGCIRLHPEDVANLFPRVEAGDAVRLIYEPVLMTRTDEGSIYLEVHRDVYNRSHEPWRALMDRAMALNATEEIDWARAEAVIHAAEGVARRISGEPSPLQRIN